MTPATRKRRRIDDENDDDCDSNKPSTSTENSNDETMNGEQTLEITELNPSKPSPYHFKENSESCYLSYIPKKWSPLNYYRIPTDIVINAIRNCGSEGLGRVEIGRLLGLDASTKSGGRKVTTAIQTVISDHKPYIGQYQKMDGKYRTIRFYWKAAEDESCFDEHFKEFERLAGKPCPYKMGEVVKFPNKHLNTLRMSDVTIKRLILILKILENDKVVITAHKMIKNIFEKERADGYKYQIDKKSLMKCLFALEKHKLLRVFDKTVRSDSVEYEIKIICHREIEDNDSPQVIQAIQNTIDLFNREGRIFPHGQARLAKPKKEDPDDREDSIYNSDISTLINDLKIPKSMEDRLQKYRSQAVKTSVAAKQKLPKVPKTELDDNDADMDETETEEDDSLLQIPKTATDLNNSIGRCTFHTDSESYGVQSKANRLFLLHQVAHQFIYGDEDPSAPTFYDLFPVNDLIRNWQERDEKNAHVFIDDDSMMRFVPRLPKYEEHERGWFLLQDFLAVVPLSVLVMVAYLPPKIDKELLFSYLHHPIRRHLCVGYLKASLRSDLMNDKRIARKLEHAFMCLGAMGIAAIAPNPATKRFTTMFTDFFYISRRGILYDTSTSEKGFHQVTLPINRYKCYRYEFEKLDDIVEYWLHLRAIVLSTRLNSKLSTETGNQGKSSKIYAVGAFDRTMIERPPDKPIEWIEPLKPHDGVAGFDSCLFLHVKRNWDLVKQPINSVNWYLEYYRKQFEKFKPTIDKKVSQLRQECGFYVSFLMDGKETKPYRKPETPNNSLTKANNFKKLTIAAKKIDSTPAAENTPKPRTAKSGKRKLDSIDELCHMNRLNMRSKFTSKERDQLIMIRAVGFFLNPVYRFWLNPAVLRDLMHEYVPESRTKTISSLMACGVRDLVRPHRLAYLRRIVRSLSTFPEMQKLRQTISTLPADDEEATTKFFKDAFRFAMKMLFMDSNRIPHVDTSDADFNKFLENSNVVVTKENGQSNILPLRSKKPMNVENIQHCVASNVIMSTLIHYKDGMNYEDLLSQFSPTLLQNVLHSLKKDGIISKCRTNLSDTMLRSEAVLSQYCRHFFTHRYCNDLIDTTGMLLDQMLGADNEIELVGDAPAAVLAAMIAFCDKTALLDIDMDLNIMEAFEKITDESCKKIRYLESLNLQIEKIHIYFTSPLKAVPNLQYLLKTLDSSQKIVENLKPIDSWVTQFDVKIRKDLTILYKRIKKAESVGITSEELKKAPIKSALSSLLDKLFDDSYVFHAGVDDRRWVEASYANAWTVKVGDKRYAPRPWMKANGEICASTVRWMAEALLVAVLHQPGIQMNNLLFIYEFAVQPVVIKELVNILRLSGCLNKQVKEYKTLRIRSPFDDERETVAVEIINPTIDALERFSRIFYNVPIPSNYNAGKS